MHQWKLTTTYLAEHSELLSIGLGKAGGRRVGGCGECLGAPGQGNGRQLLEAVGQALPHDGHQLGVNLLLMHAQVLCTGLD